MQRKIAFMGTPVFVVPILKHIYQNGYEISAVYTQPPKKSKRGQKIEKSPIHLFAETLNLNIRTPDQLKNNKLEYINLSNDFCSHVKSRELFLKFDPVHLSEDGHDFVFNLIKNKIN